MRTLCLFALLAVSSLSLAQTRATPDPLRNDSGSLESLLSRSIGQTSFVNVRQNFFGGLEKASPMASGRSAQMESADSGRRDVVDSDVFNAGPAGSKILVLLNGLRGMMIMNFDRGPEQPVLIGRVPPTGNHPVNMYIDWASNRGIVIENWNRKDYGSGARILTYDLSDLSKPKVVQITEVGGTVNDSRLVGNVLYLVGSKVNDSYYYDQGNKTVSYAKSFIISKDGLAVGDEKQLSSRVDYQENMGISEVKTDSGYKYYVTAITNKEGGWWSTKSEVEVLDISSTDGKIKPVLVASARGRINKRSWVQIANGALIVTSNYDTGGSNRDGKLRVAVETFKLPANGDTKITQDEAQFRQLSANRLPADQREAAVSSGPTQLRGVFIEDKEGRLAKTLPDFETLDFGDTTGQNASVQDVRYVQSGNKLSAQVFWVPANQKDPLDIVDVSDPSVAPKYQSRLLFEGWIERSIPLEYQGRNFILGLGYIVPAVNNPNNTERFGQAKLIEIISARGKERAIEIASINLPQVRWGDMGGQDKLVSVNFDASTGKGSVLFKGEHYNRQEGYVEGGQTVEFNVSADDDKALVEGPFIKGGDDWLRRVFMNKNLNVVMTFSDMELGVFAREASSGSKVVDAINRIELARNILAFESVPSLNIGVQIINKGDMWRDKDAKTELRVVALNKADAEKNEVLRKVEIDGQYADHFLNPSTGELLLLTKSSSSDYSKQTETTTRSISRFSSVNLKDSNLSADQAIIDETRTTRYDQVQIPSQQVPQIEVSSDNMQGLVSLGANEYAFVDGFNQIWKVTVTANGMKKEKVTIQIPDSIKKDATTLSLAKVEGRLILVVQKPFGKTDDNSPVSYYRNYVARISTSETAWKVSEAAIVNIPGQLEGFIKKDGADVGYLVSEDRVVDSKTGLTEPSLNSVILKDSQTAELRYMMPSAQDLKLVRSGDTNKWLFVEPMAQQDRGGPVFGDFMPGRFRRRVSSARGFQLGALDVSTDGVIYRTVRQLNGELTGYSASILKVAPVNDASRIVLSTGDKIQVVDMKPDYSVQVLNVAPVNTFVEPTNKDQQSQDDRSPTVWNLPSYAGYSYPNARSESKVDLNGSLIRIALGGYGVCEANLSAPKAQKEVKQRRP